MIYAYYTYKTIFHYDRIQYFKSIEKLFNAFGLLINNFSTRWKGIIMNKVGLRSHTGTYNSRND